jgi:hypothetical protein
VSVSLRAIGFVPCAPLLVPQVAGGSADVDAHLRDACRAVARRLAEEADGTITVAAPLAAEAAVRAGATWGFEGFGVLRRPPDSRPRLPWPLGIGDWLLDEVGWSGSREFVGVRADATATQPATGNSTLLVVGDGSARRTEKAPGHLDERAAPFDAAIAAAVREGDVTALRNLDAGLAAELMCTGAPVWRWMADQVGEATIAKAELLADTAPYGVGYFAGWWQISR